MKSKLFPSFFVSLIFIGIVNVFIFIFHLYATISWFDMVMHFLGGFFISISALTILTQKHTNFSYGQILACGLLSVLVVGIAWELMELYLGVTYLYSPDYIGDNGMDITMDITGGLIAVWYSYFKLRTL